MSTRVARWNLKIQCKMATFTYLIAPPSGMNFLHLDPYMPFSAELTDSSWASNNVPVKWWRVSYTQSPPRVVHFSNFQFLLARGLPALKIQVFHKKFTFPFGVEGALPPLILSPLSEVQFSNFQLLGEGERGDFLHCPLWGKSWGFDKKYLLPVQILCFTESLHVETNEDHC